MRANILWDVSPLVLNVDLAMRVGLNEAIILQQLHYWIRQGGSGVNYGGRRWIFNTLEAWQKQFPFWSTRTVGRAFDSLFTQGVVIAEKLRMKQHDMTKFYTIVYDHDLLAAHDNLSDATGQFGILGPANLAPPGVPTWHDVSETTTESSTEITKQNPVVPLDQTAEKPKERVEQGVGTDGKPGRLTGKRGAKKPDDSDESVVGFDPKSQVPPGVTQETWNDWIDHRTNDGKKPGAYTPRMLRAQTKQLAGHADPEAVVLASIAGGWQGLFPERVKGSGINLQADQIARVYNENCPAFAPADLDDRLRRMLTERWNEFSSLEFWEIFFRFCSRKFSGSNGYIFAMGEQRRPYLDLLVEPGRFKALCNELDQQ